MSAKVTPARQLSLSALKHVLNRRQFLTDADLNGASEDQARALSITRGILRYLGQLDGLLKQNLEKQPPSAVMHILRIGAYEILVEERAPHAVVDQAVQLAKSNYKTAGFAGLINAVLRKITSEESKTNFAASGPVILPKAFQGQMKFADADTFDAIAIAHQNGAPVDLTLKKQSEAEEFAQILDAQIVPTGSLRLRNAAQLSKLAGFDQGAWWVQDAAAALPARLLGVQKGQRVLDLCAAPGGKTLQLASVGADVTALDISQPRMKKLLANLKRCKLQAQIVVQDALQYEAEQFDAILLDAPCSASGTIRRHPELPILKKNMDLGNLLKLQRELLSKAVNLLKPRGTLVYATCSLFDAEGPAQAEWALNNLDLKEEQFDAESLGVSNSYQTTTNSLRLRPDYWSELGGMDGFFMAKFIKAG